MENLDIGQDSQKAGRDEIIKEYMRSLQKKSSAARLKNDPNTYKKMRNKRTELENEGDLEIRTE